MNTTLSVTLLWAAALLFAVSVHCTADSPELRRLRWFFASQVIVFAWMGMDDRFKFHEHIAWRLGIGDHYVLLAVAGLEAILLLLLAGRHILRRRILMSLVAAGVLFAVMIFFDACVPHDMVLRLTLKDLAKTWATVCLALFAWQFCAERIDCLKSDAFADPSSASTC